MTPGDVRSALVVAFGEGVDRGPLQLRPLAQQSLELAGLLGDRTIGGFDVSLMVEPTMPALRQELSRFLADRAPHDTVVVHLAGRLRFDPSGELYLCAPEVDAASPDDALPVTFISQELSRCRSERLVLLLDCPVDEPVWSLRPAVADRSQPVHERFRGPGRSVHVASTAAVISYLRRGQAGRAHDLAELGPALLVPAPGARVPSRALAAAALAGLLTLALVGSTLAIALLGPAGVALAAATLAVLAWPALRLGTDVWHRYPAVEPVPGQGVPFYRLYMMRRSQKSSDYFRHHDPNR